MCELRNLKSSTALGLRVLLPMRISSLVTLGLTCWVPPLRVPLPSMCASIESMSYRELQQACKAAGLGARGKADELRSRLLESQGGQGDTDASTGVSEPTSITSDLEGLADAKDSLGFLDDVPFTDLEAEAESVDDNRNPFDDALFKDLEEQLLPPGEFDAIGTFQPSGRTKGTDAAAKPSPLGTLDELDGLLGPPSSPSELGNDDTAGGADATFPAERFDEKWLDDLFGPIDEEPSPVSSPPAGGARGSPRGRDFGAASDVLGEWDAFESGGGRGEQLRERRVRSDDPNEGLRRGILSASASREHVRVLSMMTKWRARKDEGTAPVEEPVYRAAITACEHEGRWQLAAELLNELEEFGIPLATSHFNMALRACDRHKRWQEGLALFDRMRANGLRPDARTFECLVRTCAKADQPAMVLTLWEMLREEQAANPPLEVTAFTYNVLMRALSEAGGGSRPGPHRVESANRVLEAFDQALALGIQLDDSGCFLHPPPPLHPAPLPPLARALVAAPLCLPPGDCNLAAPLCLPPGECTRGAPSPAHPCDDHLVTACRYKHGLRACDLSGQWRRALNLLKMMREHGIVPDILCYGNVMNACARDGRSQTVLQLHAQMRSEGLQPNAFCYNAAIGAAARAKKWRSAIELMNEMETEAAATGDPSIAPTKHTYTTVIRACAAVAQWRPAQSTLGRMLKAGIEPTSFDYGCIIEACGRAGEVGRGERSHPPTASRRRPARPGLPPHALTSCPPRLPSGVPRWSR